MAEDGPDLQDFISGEVSEKSKWAEYRATLKREKGERWAAHRAFIYPDGNVGISVITIQGQERLQTNQKKV